MKNVLTDINICFSLQTDNENVEKDSSTDQNAKLYFIHCITVKCLINIFQLFCVPYIFIEILVLSIV